MTIVFDGKKLAKEKEEKLAAQVAKFKKEKGIAPKLVSILVGDNPSSVLYTKIKQKSAERIGIDFFVEKFSDDVDITLLLYRIKVNNEDPKVHGIMVQLPLQINPPAGGEKSKNYELEVLSLISPLKDVDCLTPENLGLLLMGGPRFLPATIKGILEIINQLSNYQIVNWRGVEGAAVCVVGASDIVGKPLALVLSNMRATVTICRSRTKNLADFTKKADILISATGVPGLIKKEMVKPGVIVIDIGSPKGDVDFDEVKDIASFITPVPGGVGPLTVVSLLENTFQAAGTQDVLLRG